jgi:hypothetical protein
VARIEVRRRGSTGIFSSSARSRAGGAGARRDPGFGSASDHLETDGASSPVAVVLHRAPHRSRARAAEPPAERAHRRARRPGPPRSRPTAARCELRADQRGDDARGERRQPVSKRGLAWSQLLEARAQRFATATVQWIGQ